ncbi:Wzy polymerase domain-containing protein [Gallaecimonas kandeliae]|uniref:PglL family O-oligosaccharyltransferase n=1 Tax=Gallaecimonas kandeliae TaxID=3029055 RepID=UPI0026474193|nr:Wzy polymerase domain-containing protein [Gallaecimonas kandeliae]WKE66800.1 Wzy polymerase domain-containing protein [Gallaecimonas kandeliae]
MTTINNNKLAWAAFGLLFLFAAQYFQHNIGGYGLQLSFNNTVWMAALLMITVGVFRGVGNGYWILPRAWRQYLLLFIVLFLPLAWSGDTAEYAIGRFFGVLGGLLFLLALFQSFDAKRDEKVLLFIFVLAAGIQVVLGALQLLGWQWLPIGRISDSGIRPQGIFQQPNVFASFIATGMMAALWLLARYEAPTKALSKWLWFGVIYLTLLFSAFDQYVTLSRTGILAQVGGLLLFLFTSKKSSRALLLGVSLVIVGELGGYFYGVLADNVVRSAATVTDSNGRNAIWTVTAQIFLAHPLAGVGLGGFEAAYANQRAIAFAQSGLWSLPNVDHPHNELLFWATEGGILPLFGILLFSGALVWRLRSLGRLGFAYAAMIFPIALHCMTEYPFYHSATHWFVFLTLLFLIEAQIGELERRQVALPYVWKSMTAIGVIVGEIFLATNLHTISKLVQVVRANEVAKEGDSPLAPLLDIVNPIVFQNHIEHIAMAARLQLALANRDEKALREYIDWGWQYSQVVVRKDIFEKMLIAANALGDKQEAAKIRQRAQWLFPEDPHVHNDHQSGAVSNP